MLNAWRYGVEFICAYTSNRIGKTTVEIMNWILWAFPNDPQWLIFQPYTDKHGRHVEVLPRPPFAQVAKLRKLGESLGLTANPNLSPSDPENQKWVEATQHLVAPAFPRPPWNRGGTVWVGAPDAAHHNQVIMPLWLEWLPKSSIESTREKDKSITIVIRPTEGPPTVWSWVGKSYEAKDTKWSSGAVDAIILTEGVPYVIFKEIKLRFKDPSFGGHDYTPYEPANTAGSSALAWHIAKRDDENMQWPKAYHVFTGFKVALAPDWIISNEKRNEMLKAFANDPEGQARIEGEFYTSSGLVLDNLDLKHHVIKDWTIADLFKRYPTAKIYRGLDPGYDHPTCCAWGALLPCNTWVIYRIYSKRGTTISTRCKDIIELSGNEQKKIRVDEGIEQMHEVPTGPESELIEATIMDFHAFKADETTGLSNSHHYILQGLQVIKSTTAKPEDRASELNDKLKLSPLSPSVNPEHEGKPAARIYFLAKGPGVLEALTKWGNFFWERYRGGELKGMPKDKIPDHNDDELDAVCYLTSSKIIWTNYTRFANVDARGLTAEQAEDSEDDED